MKIRFTILLFVLFSSVASFCQTDSIFHFRRNYTGPIINFSVDNLGNVYLLFQNGQLKKLTPDGDSAAVFNNVRKYGKLYSIDVTNPLKVLLYYRDFGTVVTLDRFLNVRSTLDLRTQNSLQVKAIGQSYDNNIWIFDEIESKLKKIADDGHLLDQSNDFRQIFDSTPSPNKIIDQNKTVYLYDPAKGVYEFDYYSAFKSRIPFLGWTDFNVVNDAIVGRDKTFLYRYNAGSLQLQQFPVPAFMNEAEKIVIAPGMVYLLKDGAIMVYSYK
ncbi:MAG: hypothetical protein ABI415_07915 [Flavitalea sp.]